MPALTQTLRYRKYEDLFRTCQIKRRAAEG